MWLTPSSAARRSTEIAVWLGGAVSPPGPESCMAPYPSRATGRPARMPKPPGGLPLLTFTTRLWGWPSLGCALAVARRRLAGAVACRLLAAVHALAVACGACRGKPWAGRCRHSLLVVHVPAAAQQGGECGDHQDGHRGAEHDDQAVVEWAREQLREEPLAGQHADLVSGQVREHAGWGEQL